MRQIKVLIKLALLLVVALVFCVFLIPMLAPVVSSHHDQVTKQRLLRTVAKELPLHASMAEMNTFMRRHTDRYSFDEYNEQYAGLLPQTALDRLLADRQVQIFLKVNEHTHTFERAEVNVLYTGP